MPRFFFDFLSKHTIAVDKTGTTLLNLAAAKAEAATAAGEWMKDHVSAEGAELTMTVRDGNPAPLFLVSACIKVIPTR